MKNFYIKLTVVLSIFFLSPNYSYSYIASNDGQGCKATCPHGTCHWDGSFGICSCTDDGYPKCEKIGLAVGDVNSVEGSKGEIVADDTEAILNFLRNLESNINPEIHELK